MNWKAVAAVAVSAVLSISSWPAGGAAWDERPATPAANETAVTLDIDNFGRVSPAYYRGEQPDSEDYFALSQFGIRTVIDLQAKGDADEARLVRGAGMAFVRIPMTTRVPPTPAQVARFLRIVTDPAHQPVYVHCKEGRHRTGVMTALYRMERHGWTADQAYAEMKRYDFGPGWLHPEFKQFVFRHASQRNSPLR